MGSHTVTSNTYFYRPFKAWSSITMNSNSIAVKSEVYHLLNVLTRNHVYCLPREINYPSMIRLSISSMSPISNKFKKSFVKSGNTKPI